MRALTPLLDDICSGNTERRAPTFRIEIFDLRSGTTTTIGDIVAGNVLEPIVGPRDFTDFVTAISVKEVKGNYATGGIASTTATVTVEDPTGAFDPFGLIADPTLDTRYFRQGNVVRVYEGDAAVPPEDWARTMTMEIRGQVGYVRSRAVGSEGISKLSFKMVSREASFLAYERTSREFTNGETYLAIGETVARDEMGLALAEIDFSGWGNRLLRHSTLTLAGESPIVLLARVMFVDGFIPRFNGDGVLTQHLSILGGSIDRFYTSHNVIRSIEWPIADVQAADTVCVKGLDFNLSRRDQPRQIVAKVDVTTGYFTDDERIEAFFADDHTILADNLQLVVLKGVNGGIISIGGGESGVGIPAPNEFQEGYIGMEISISTGYAPWLAVFLLATYTALAAVPDEVVTSGFGVQFGFTINIGGIAQAVALASAMLIMSGIGRGKYEIWGDPFEYVFEELNECAQMEGVGEFSENRIEVLNHLIDDAATCQGLAAAVLFMEQAGRHPRTVRMAHDIALEPADVWSSTVDDRVYLIESIARTITRSETALDATLSVLEITDGIEVTG